MFCFLLFSFSQPSLAQSTEKNFVRQLVLNSSNWKVLKHKFIQNQISDAQTQSQFEWQLGVSSGYETNQNQSYSSTTLVTADTNRYLSDLSLSKAFATGTDLTFTYSQAAISFNTISAKTNLSALGLQLKQSLWSNFFGAAQRSQLSSAKESIRLQQLTLIEQGESELLSVLGLYSKALSNQQSFNESEKVFKRYEELARSVLRKQKYGNASPGESSQIQAELEAQRENLNLQRLNLNSSLNDLKAALNLKTLPTPLQALNRPDEISLPQKAQTSEVYRPLQIQQLKKNISQMSYDQSLSENRPDLDLILQHNSASADESQGTATNNVVRGFYPKRYIGLQFSYSFGSDTRSQKILQKKLSLQSETLLEQNARLQFEADQKNIQEKVETLKSNFTTLKNQLKFRQQAADELQRSYNQGRTDVSVLIQALNKASQNQIELYKAQSNLIVALYSNLSQHDQLLNEFGIDPVAQAE